MLFITSLDRYSEIFCPINSGPRLGVIFIASFYQHLQISTSPCHLLVSAFIIIPEESAEEKGGLLFILKQVSSLL